MNIFLNTRIPAFLYELRLSKIRQLFSAFILPNILKLALIV